MESDTEGKVLARALIGASARHDLVAVKNLLRNVSANVQDGETGYTPLHAAVAGCAPPQAESKASGDDQEESEHSNIDLKNETVAPNAEDKAADIVQLLFENGAIWNDLDTQNETAGCIAWRLGLERVYKQIVDAGVRAELLLNRLAELDNGDEEDDDEDEDDDDGDYDDSEDKHEDNDEISQSGQSTKPPQSTKVQEESAAKAVRGQETSSSTNDERKEPPSDYIDHWDSNSAFLQSSLRFTSTQLLDSSSNAVMMDWETAIMTRHAETLLPKPGLRAMNIGHGMGIVDTAIQTHAPSEHHIVEAHPAVLARMKENGWLDKPGVRVHEGRWQDVLPRLIEEGVELDAIYYDTFAEDYKDFKDLFSEQVIGLMEQSGRFGFYHGLGADRRVCYDVYTSVAEMDLLEAGFKTVWEDIPVPEIEWEGVRRPYWNVGVYRLPTCTYL